MEKLESIIDKFHSQLDEHKGDLKKEDMEEIAKGFTKQYPGFNDLAGVLMKSVHETKKLTEQDEEEEGSDVDWIEIDGKKEEIKGFDNLSENMYMVEIDGADYYVAENREDAGKAARQYWLEMVQNDPEEFRVMVGDEALVNWALGQSAGPGTTKVTSLSKWLDLYLDVPEEHFGSYDGEEIETTISESLREKLGYGSTEIVAYRHN